MQTEQNDYTNQIEHATTWWFTMNLYLSLSFCKNSIIDLNKWTLNLKTGGILYLPTKKGRETP